MFVIPGVFKPESRGLRSVEERLILELGIVSPEIFCHHKSAAADSYTVVKVFHQDGRSPDHVGDEYDFKQNHENRY